MNQKLTRAEIEKIQNMCFENPQKACAIAQVIINTCQIVSCSTYARLKEKKKRTVLYQSQEITGISIEDRRVLSLRL